MTAAGVFGASDADDSIHIHEHYGCTQQELWDAITDPERLSAWLGGACSIEARVGGNVRFELPDDGIVATGVVRACSPPQPGMTVAHIEHTFIDGARPELTSVCAWAIVRLDSGCDLHFTMDGTGEAGGGAFAGVFGRMAEAEDASASSEATTEDEAAAAFASAPTVLLVDWVHDEIPRTIAATAPVVYGKIGPAEDDWARIEPTADDPGYRAVRGPKPEHVDLLHLDWTLGFDDFVAVAQELGARTFWYHSARTRPPAPADNRGVWVPSRQSTRQRQIVEDAGMAYIDNHYIVDIAEGSRGRPAR